MQVTAVNKDGSIKRKLIYSNVILMVDKYDEVTFHVNEPGDVQLDFKFTFRDEGEKYSAEGKINDDGHTVELVLNNWYADTKIENVQPIEIPLENGKKIWVKYGTISNEKESFRLLYFSVWGVAQ
jgi:hypothetical protein